MADTMSGKITVKLFAFLREKLPPENDGYGFEYTLKQDTVPQDIIDLLEISERMVNLVMVDGRHLLREEYRTRVLKPGESLAIVPPV